ncbi:gliding motility-associated C-terminal domain-containing protein [Cyclobacterium sp. 1_MG-2023]|uniref:DUF7507 domain-containing protein n=1 Tax=Cyclobacterium sp. 1_MG-2023 TaxID=3062681 RepID=UPI0026E21A16|nr:gliding motility-associated C-terminal domain-containing protein [Cyclobacterium sp. 1_MG-2023]MDO6440003.1 gliding motility-associated C-terminal domain-containing protein [Cyclobacterium sp. 1_MG-2023]
MNAFNQIFTGKFISFILMGLFFWLAAPFLGNAQNDNRIPFKHRVGNSAPDDNIFHIRGDFTLIGNTNITMANYSTSSENSLNDMRFVDIDGDPHTFNSSEATLLFSGENGADPNCTEIVYAGLYWAGKSNIGQGLSFDLTENITSTELTEVDQEQLILPEETIEHSSYTMSYYMDFDEKGMLFPYYYFGSPESQPLTFAYLNDSLGKILYRFGNEEWNEVENISTTDSAGLSKATFDPIEFEENGVTFSIHTLHRSMTSDMDDIGPKDFNVGLKSFGSYYPIYPHTVNFDKRKVKFKGPGASEYTEITAQGNSILYPHNELEDIYVGYADVTELVKKHGAGNYTLADLALVEGVGNQTGYTGNWGMVVIYQNSKMDWRDISVFDGYSFVQSLDGEEHIGEVEITGFETINQGPVRLKLGIMAAEGDKSIKGDFLQIRNQENKWAPLYHPKSVSSNFFNSSIYSPVPDQEGNLVESPRNPNLEHNTGADILQWEVPNPNNSIITNKQNSFRFRYGTNQDVYAIYAFAFSVPSYVPEIQAYNHIKSIDGNPPEEEPTIEPGQEITYTLNINNYGTENSLDNKVIIPLPPTATFVNAGQVPQDVGTVTFDPEMGLAGAIIWEIDELPLLENPSETIATLEYTLKLSEDCFFWANNNCEIKISIDGSMSGMGAISNHNFSNLPFIQGFMKDNCSGEAIYGPLEIPITGKAEFAATHCNSQVDFPSLGPIELPDFCQGDAPIDLNSFVSPSQEGYSIYYFMEEEGGEAIPSYQVNTAHVGSEQIWVAEGPSKNCTGIRSLLTINVVKKASPPGVRNQTICQFSTTNTFEIFNINEHELHYYPDNDPSSDPLTEVPVIDPDKIGVYTVWVSHSKEGVCDSPRVPVSITVEDCSYQPDINLDKSVDKEHYSQVNDTITISLVVSNPRKVPLVDVKVHDDLTNEVWTIPYLDIMESQTFTVSYVTTQQDIDRGYINSISSVTANPIIGGFVHDTEIEKIEALIYADGFLFNEITTTPEPCPPPDEAMGTLHIRFPGYIPQTGRYLLVKKENNQEYTGNFQNLIHIKVAVPHGQYSVKIWDVNENLLEVKGSFTVEKKAFVAFNVPAEINACFPYELIPESAFQLDYFLEDPDGKPVNQNNQGGFPLYASGTYEITGTDPSGQLCPIVKRFDANITMPLDVEMELAPFCKEDVFTTLILRKDITGLEVKWYRLLSEESIHLQTYDNNTTLTIQEAGLYTVTLTNKEGCMVGRGQMEVNKSFSEMPQLENLYSICPENNREVLIDIGQGFSASQWYLNGKFVGTGDVFSPNIAGFYNLLAIDEQGCSFSVDFEVEEVCEAKVHFPNAMLPGDPEKPFTVFANNLISEIEVFIHNRWGALIYYCTDKKPQGNQASTCLWDGYYNNQKVPGGGYSVTIQYVTKKEKEAHTVKGIITVIE